jgi:hypothetical protein
VGVGSTLGTADFSGLKVSQGFTVESQLPDVLLHENVLSGENGA